ncbi:uncharacterized protein LOC143151604 [Ptiloglossa arizonensis]|uniref:uncharacterized protein LOC143151604 n=1 Tax=Ptiloglossa arizonensis TaxID=3350558 RepID=UPI003FA05AAD
MQLPAGKQDNASLNAVNNDAPRTNRLFVYDRASKREYLVDTGSDLCVYPRAQVTGPVVKTTYELFAANDSTIYTYGVRTFQLDLGLRRAFAWKFVVTDVDKPIFGADFLSHFGLLVDLKNRRLLDQAISLISRGRVAAMEVGSIRTITGDSPRYDRLLAEFPRITRPSATPSENTPIEVEMPPRDIAKSTMMSLEYALLILIIIHF